MKSWKHENIFRNYTQTWSKLSSKDDSKIEKLWGMEMISIFNRWTGTLHMVYVKTLKGRTNIRSIVVCEKMLELSNNFVTICCIIATHIVMFMRPFNVYVIIKSILQPIVCNKLSGSSNFKASTGWLKNFKSWHWHKGRRLKEYPCLMMVHLLAKWNKNCSVWWKVRDVWEMMSSFASKRACTVWDFKLSRDWVMVVVKMNANWPIGYLCLWLESPRYVDALKM